MTTTEHRMAGDRPAGAGVRSSRPLGSPDTAVLGAAVVAATEQERDALAGDLHDGVVQSLVAARLAVDLAERGGADPEHLTGVRAALAEALGEARGALWHLRSRGADGDVRRALLMLVERATDTGRTLRVRLAEDVGLVSPIAAVLTYRLVQRAATLAGDLEVELGRRNGMVNLTLCSADLDTDDGQLSRAVDRVVLAGGSVTHVPAGLVVTIPAEEVRG